MKTIPHKQLIVSTGIALLVFAVGFISERGPWDDAGQKALLTQNVVAVDPILLDSDIDADGLPDWKERLYGTDMKAGDSDGDGTSDGEEVRLGRDPNKKNTAKEGVPPTDTISYLEDKTPLATTTSDELVAKKAFFAKLLAERSMQIKEDTLRELVKKDIDPKVFLPGNELAMMNIISDNSPEAVRKYVNDFGVIINKYTSVKAHRSEEEILKDVFEKKSASAIKELSLPAITYRNFSKDLMALSVPSVLAMANLKIANGYEGMAKGIIGMQMVYTKPTVGVAGYEAYTKYRFDVTDGYAEIVNYLWKNKYTFTENEPGYPFYWKSLATLGKEKASL